MKMLKTRFFLYGTGTLVGMMILTVVVMPHIIQTDVVINVVGEDQNGDPICEIVNRGFLPVYCYVNVPSNASKAVVPYCTGTNDRWREARYCTNFVNLISLPDTIHKLAARESVRVVALGAGTESGPVRIEVTYSTRSVATWHWWTDTKDYFAGGFCQNASRVWIPTKGTKVVK